MIIGSLPDNSDKFYLVIKNKVEEVGTKIFVSNKRESLNRNDRYFAKIFTHKQAIDKKLI